MSGFAHGTLPHGALTLVGTAAPPVVPLGPLDTSLPMFFAAEITIYQPGSTAVSFTFSHGAAPHGALSMAGQVYAQSSIMRASDLGYVTRSSDGPGLQVYPAVLDQAFAINRRIALNPVSDKVSASWGTLTLENADGGYNSIASTLNCDGRSVMIYAGVKTYDAARGIWLDPSYSDLRPLWGGVATPWFCDDVSLQIPLRDATYWLDQPLQSTLYGGTGGLDGGADLVGLPKPMTRGGTNAAPVLNVSPVLVDAANLIYQYNDGPGTVVTLSEDGLQSGIVFSSDVADLYTGSTSAGHYRTCNALGLFQLGSTPGQITADVTGSFRSGAQPTTAALLALQILIDDAQLPAQYIDQPSFLAANAAYPYQAGYFTGTTATTANVEVANFLTSIAASLSPSRAGKLQVFAPRVLPPSPIAAATYDPSTIVSLVPQSLGSPLDPPPYRWQVGALQNWTIMTSALNGTISAARKSFLANQYRNSGWSNPTIQLAYRRPSDPGVLGTYLTTAADAQSVANELGALWGVVPGRTLYAMQVPLALGLRHEIGDLLQVTWPARNLMTGAIGQVVGEQVTSSDNTSTLLVLI